MFSHSNNSLAMEITVLSAEGLKTSSSLSLFSHRLRPFIALSTVPPDSTAATSGSTSSNGDKRRHVYETRVDDRGGANPTWGDKFRLPINTAFFSGRYSGFYVQLYTKRLMLGRAHLGWCHVPAQDIGPSPCGSPRFLSYRLRARDGSRTRAVINLSVKVEGFGPVGGQAVSRTLPTCQTVIGIPVGSYSSVGGLSSTCQGRFNVSYTSL